MQRPAQSTFLVWTARPFAIFWQGKEAVSIDLLQHPDPHISQFHRPRIEVVPIVVGQIEFSRPNRGRGMERA